ILGMTPDAYGLVGLITGAGYLVGTFIARRRAGTLSSAQLGLHGTAFSVAGAAGFLVVATVGPLAVASLLAMMVVFAGGLGIVYPTRAAAALARHPLTAGSASAVIGCAQMGFGMVGTAVLSLCDHDTAMPLGLLVMTFSALALASATAVRRMLVA